MTNDLKQKLKELFDQAEEEFPDKSTAFLLEITAQRAQQTKLKRNCDSGDVAEAVG